MRASSTEMRNPEDNGGSASPAGWFRGLGWTWCWCLLLVIGLGLPQAKGAEAAPAKKSKKELPGADIFDSANIIQINIQLSQSGFNTLARSGGFGRGGGAERPEVKATITDGLKTYTNVAVHLKGAAGSFRPIFDQPAFTLNFNKFAEGQDFHGLHKISLNNSVQDDTFLCEKIARELFEAAGVPVPRADYAVVSLNGKILGLYVLLEGYNKQLLKRYFKNTSGNLYDGGFCQEVSEHLSVNSGEKPNEHPGMRRMISALSASRQNNRLEDLSKVIDVDRFFSMIAMEIITCHWDGYAMNRNNYRVFHDMGQDRMVFMPHGMDQTFGMGGGRSSTDISIIPHMQGVAASRLLSSPEGRERYLQRAAELSTNVFNFNTITNRIRELERRILPVLARLEPGSERGYRSRVNYLIRNIEERKDFLDQQFEAPRVALTFDNSGTARLDGWKPKATLGAATFSLSLAEGNRKAMRIEASQGAAAGSWRTKVLLRPGRYVFEGQVKSDGVSTEPGNGVGLRVSGAPAAKIINGGPTTWLDLSYPIEVTEMREVELVCEMKANRGQAWFDQGSLRLRRVP